MGKAARAIIIENDQLLVMRRVKHGSQYFTLVGGRANEGEPMEQALVREVREETGMEIIGASLVFYEDHPEPYNQQYVYVCNIGENKGAALRVDSEEHELNQMGFNIHQPMWVSQKAFANLAFRTPLLQQAIIRGLKHGFPSKPQKLG